MPESPYSPSRLYLEASVQKKPPHRKEGKMSKQEKSFQAYFMKLAKPLNYHRISLTNGSGFPDVIGFHGDRHSLVELKDLELGVRGDRKLRQFFEDTQPPWYAEYLAEGGKRLFVSFRIRNAQGAKWYGLWQIEPISLKGLIANVFTYLDMCAVPKYYQEYKTCKEMIEEIEKWPSLD